MPSTGPEPALGQSARPTIRVACGVLQRPDGRVLIAQRPHGKLAAGKWEFPGGKLEAGESASQALVRELYEELGIAVQAATPLIRFRYDYSDRRVDLDTLRVTAWRGEPQAREQQQFDWRLPQNLADLDVLPTVAPIAAALQLPSHYVFTPPVADAAALLAELHRLPAGALLRLRMPQLGDAAYEQQARQLLPACHARGLRLMLDRDPQQVDRLGADGWHASDARLRALRGRPLPAGCWFAASLHDAASVAAARRCGADFAVLGPVQSTPSHPESRPLGWDAFAALVQTAAMPVYALGGVGPAQLSAAQQHGAQGTAGIRAYWSAALS